MHTPPPHTLQHVYYPRSQTATCIPYPPPHAAAYIPHPPRYSARTVHSGEQVHTFLDAGDLGRLSQTGKHMLSLCFDEVGGCIWAGIDTCCAILCLGGASWKGKRAGGGYFLARARGLAAEAGGRGVGLFGVVDNGQPGRASMPLRMFIAFFFRNRERRGGKGSPPDKGRTSLAWDQKRLPCFI